MVGGGTLAPGEKAWSLENSPTWAVATVCTVFVAIGLLLVYALEKIEKRLKSAHRKPLVHALQKMKEELMLLGFISLLLTAMESYVASICVKTTILEHWSPCRAIDEDKVSPPPEAAGGARRRLLAPDTWPTMAWGEGALHHRRILSQNTAATCKPGHSPFVSTQTLIELHTFLFVLAVVHIAYSVFAMLLASWRVKRWRACEEEAQSRETVDNRREVIKSLSLHRQTTFVKYHTSTRWSRNRFFVWIICFFRQFGKSVVKADYLALRLGFIETHNTGRKFDFHKYLVRSLEDEFEKVVGISASLWALAIIFVLFNVAGTNLFFWLAFFPILRTFKDVTNWKIINWKIMKFETTKRTIKLVVVVGAKQQMVIATLALESAGFRRGGRFAGEMKPRDELFWFNKPQLILFLIHFVLFQNAFEMATFLSFAWQFGFHSCLLRNKPLVYSRLGVGLVAQILCSYSTLPLYALVTQMGSSYKHSIFNEDIKHKLHHWRKGAKQRVRKGNSLAGRSQEDSSTTATYSRRSSDSDSDSADEIPGFDTINEDGESRFESDPTTNSGRGFHMPQQESQSFPSLEISIENENDGRQFLVPTSQAVSSSITRTNSVPFNPKRTVHFDPRFYKLSNKGLEAPDDAGHFFKSGPL